MTEKLTEVLDEKTMANIMPFSGGHLPVADRALAQGMAMQRVSTEYVTAVKVQEPRVIAKVAKNVLTESQLAGASFYYRWEVKNKKTGKKSVVMGASIDLAMCIARHYGNCVIDVELVQDTLTHIVLKATFIDLETGFTIPRLFRQRKSQDIGSGYGEERSEDIVFQIAQSKAQRNAIVKALPAWLLEQAIEKARDAEINRIKPENMELARAKVLDFFGTYGISADRIEHARGRKVAEWTPEDIADLRASATTLKEGRASADEMFPKVEEKKPVKKSPVKKPPEKEKPDTGKESLETEPEINLVEILSSDIVDSPLWDGFVELFMEAENKTWEEFVQTAVNDPDKVKSLFGLYREGVESRESSDGEPDSGSGGDDPGTGSSAGMTFEDELFVDEWKKLRSGFRAYVMKNYARFNQCSEACKRKAQDKYARLVDENWPTVEQVATYLETGGDSKGTSKNVDSTGSDTAESGKIEDSKEFKELSVLKTQYPKEVMTVVKGRSPKSIEQVKGWIARIDGMVDHLKDGVPSS